MDGNNRWSKTNNTKPYDAYLKGSKKLLEISNYIFSNYETKYITAFALSKNNLNIPYEKIKILKSVISYFLNNLGNISHFKFNIILRGNLNFLNKNLLNKVNDLNSQNTKYLKSLVILVNYSGQIDIVNSANQLLKSKNLISKKNFEKKLFLSDFPNPDILIRTGGFQRISDFMLYQLAFTDLFFLRKMWPDINKNDVKKIINNFRKIDRKFGL